MFVRFRSTGGHEALPLALGAVGAVILGESGVGEAASTADITGRRYASLAPRHTRQLRRPAPLADGHGGEQWHGPSQVRPVVLTTGSASSTTTASRSSSVSTTTTATAATTAAATTTAFQSASKDLLGHLIGSKSLLPASPGAAIATAKCQSPLLPS